MVSLAQSLSHSILFNSNQQSLDPGGSSEQACAPRVNDLAVGSFGEERGISPKRELLCRVTAFFHSDEVAKKQALAELDTWTDEKVSRQTNFLNDIMSDIQIHDVAAANTINQLKETLPVQYIDVKTKLGQSDGRTQLRNIWQIQPQAGPTPSHPESPQNEECNVDNFDGSFPPPQAYPNADHSNGSFPLSQAYLEGKLPPCENTTKSDSLEWPQIVRDPNLNFDHMEYNPSNFFGAIEVSEDNQSGPAKRPWTLKKKSLCPANPYREWYINYALIKSFLKHNEEVSKEIKTTLWLKTLTYLSQFAFMTQPAVFGFQIAPWQRTDDNYFRTNLSEAQRIFNSLMCRHLGVLEDALLFVTDKSFYNVLQRQLLIHEKAQITAWRDIQFDALFASLRENPEQNVFLDSTHIFAAAKEKPITSTRDELKEKLLAEQKRYLGVLKESKASDAEVCAFKESFKKNIVVLANINIYGSQAVYLFMPCPDSEQNLDDFRKSFNDIANHNGYVLGPHQLMENWICCVDQPQDVVKSLKKYMRWPRGQVKLPEDTSALCEFESMKRFEGTGIYIQFIGLAKHRSTPPYQKVLCEATDALIQGLEKEGIFEKMNEKPLSDLLKMSLNKMQFAMEQAIIQKDSLPGFSNQIQIIHAELAMLLAVLKPFQAEDFETVMQEAHKDMLPEEFSVIPRFVLKNSGMRCVSSVIDACQILKGKDDLFIATQSHCYYEVAKNMPGLVLDSKDPLGSAEQMATKLEGKKLDLYVAEFYHNISEELDRYENQDVQAQVDALFDKELVAEQFTVAIDVTIGMEDQKKICAFLKHNKKRIDDGQLNVVFFRSGQKFDMIGLDHFNWGIMQVINNNNLFAAFNQEALNLKPNPRRNPISPSNLQGITYFFKYGKKEIDLYRKAISDNNNSLFQMCKQMGMVPDENSLYGKNLIEMAPIRGKKVFLDIRSSWAMTVGKASLFYGNLSLYLMYLSKTNPTQYPIEARPSFGFHHSNITGIGNKKLRFNVGLEDKDTLKRYCQVFSDLNSIFEDLRTKYIRPEDCVAIVTQMLANPLDLTTYLQLRKKNPHHQLNKQLELAELELRFGDLNGARRLLESKTTEMKVLPPKKTDKQKLQELFITLTKKEEAREQVVLDHHPVLEALLSPEINNLKLIAHVAAMYHGFSQAHKLQPYEIKRRIENVLLQDLKFFSKEELNICAASLSRAQTVLKDRYNDLLYKIVVSLKKAVTDLAKNKETKEKFLTTLPRTLNLRERPHEPSNGNKATHPQNILGDFQTSVNYYAKPEHERNAPSNGDQILEMDNSHIGRFLSASVGNNSISLDQVIDISNNRKINEHLKKINRDLPVNVPRLDDDITQLMTFMDIGMNRLYSTLDRAVSEAQKDAAPDFVKACRELEKVLREHKIRLLNASHLFQENDFLQVVPKDHQLQINTLSKKYSVVLFLMNENESVFSKLLQLTSLARVDPEGCMKAMRVPFPNYKG